MIPKDKSILLVEDNRDDVFFMLRAAKIAGLVNPIHVVEDGQAAIDYLAGCGASADRPKNALPGLVFLDLKLPRKGGLEVLEWLRGQESLRTTVVIVLTTSRESSDVDRAYQLGANAYVVKPAATELVAMLQAVKQFWFRFNEFKSDLL